MKGNIKLFAALMVTLSCMPLVACDGNGGQINKPNATKITLYTREFEQWSKDWLDDMVDDFNADPANEDVFVDVKFYTADTYLEALKVARENGKAPDIYISPHSDVYNLLSSHHAAPLNEYLSQAAIDDMVDSVKEMVTYDGKIYAYPWNLEPATLLFYRKDMLSEAGVANPPKTWDELYSACSKIKTTLDLGEYCIGLPLGAGELSWVTYGMQQNTTGGLAVDESWRESRIGHEGYRDIAEFFYNIYVNSYAPTAALTNEGYTYIVDALCEGKLAMTFAGAWCVAEIYDYMPEMVEKIGIVPIPTKSGDYSKTTSSNGGWSFFISEESKHKDLAGKFINWMFTEDAERTAKYFIKAYNSKAPTSKSVKDYLDTVQTEVPSEWISVINDVASKAIPEAQYPYDISLEFGKILETMQIKCKDNTFAALYDSSLTTAQNNIAIIMQRATYPTNPKYDYEGE